jgi:cell division septal protein FtsQ
MSAVSAPADRRFRRAHVKPTRKRRYWRRLVKPLVRSALAAVVAGFAIYWGSSVVADARMLQIDRIVVHGNERLSKSEVLVLLTGLRGESVVWTDLNRWRDQLLGSPWVREAALRRVLPSTIEVLVWERQPTMLARVDGEMYLVDDGGAVIDQFGPQYADLDLPLVDGLVAHGRLGSGVDEARAELAMQLIGGLKARPDIARRLSQIDITDPHNVTVILSGDSAVLELGDEQFLPRLQSYLELASALRERVADIDHVDLRFDKRIYVRPAGRPAEPVKTGRAAVGARGGFADAKAAPTNKTRTGHP